MTIRPTVRLGALTLALSLALAAPVAVAAAQPDAVTGWQAHRDEMLALHGPGLGGHVVDCVALHGSAAGALGPSGTMTGGMMAGGEVVR